EKQAAEAEGGEDDRGDVEAREGPLCDVLEHEVGDDEVDDRDRQHHVEQDLPRHVIDDPAREAGADGGGECDDETEGAHGRTALGDREDREQVVCISGMMMPPAEAWITRPMSITGYTGAIAQISVPTMNSPIAVKKRPRVVIFWMRNAVTGIMMPLTSMKLVVTHCAAPAVISK